MPRSLSLVIVHLVFSTKDRQPLLDEEIRPALFAYLATVVRNSGCECYRVGGVNDHVHLAIRMGKQQTIAKLIEQVKRSSSKWLKTQSPELIRFAWQRGYGAFSVSPADIQVLLQYIDKQEAHHRKHSFQDEFVGFLRKYGMDSEDAHLWD